MAQTMQYDSAALRDACQSTTYVNTDLIDRMIADHYGRLEQAGLTQDNEHGVPQLIAISGGSGGGVSTVTKALIPTYTHYPSPFDTSDAAQEGSLKYKDIMSWSSEDAYEPYMLDPDWPSIMQEMHDEYWGLQQGEHGHRLGYAMKHPEKGLLWKEGDINPATGEPVTDEQIGTPKYKQAFHLAMQYMVARFFEVGQERGINATLIVDDHLDAPDVAEAIFDIANERNAFSLYLPVSLELDSVHDRWDTRKHEGKKRRAENEGAEVINTRPVMFPTHIATANHLAGLLKEPMEGPAAHADMTIVWDNNGLVPKPIAEVRNVDGAKQLHFIDRNGVDGRTLLERAAFNTLEDIGDGMPGLEGMTRAGVDGNFVKISYMYSPGADETEHDFGEWEDYKDRRNMYHVSLIHDGTSWSRLDYDTETDQKRITPISERDLMQVPGFHNASTGVMHQLRMQYEQTPYRAMERKHDRGINQLLDNARELLGAIQHEAQAFIQRLGM